MRAVVQRVSRVRVIVEGHVAGEIAAGLMILVGVGRDDTPAVTAGMAANIANLRIFEDDQGKMNRSLLDVKGSALVVSQFTLYGDARGQRRPSFIAAAPAGLETKIAPGFFSGAIYLWEPNCVCARWRLSAAPFNAGLRAWPFQIRQCFHALCRRRAGLTQDCCGPRRYQDSAGALREVARPPPAFGLLAPARVPSQPECLRLSAQAATRGASLQARIDRGFGSTMHGPTARALSADLAENGLQLGILDGFRQPALVRTGNAHSHQAVVEIGVDLQRLLKMRRGLIVSVARAKRHAQVVFYAEIRGSDRERVFKQSEAVTPALNLRVSKSSKNQ